VHANGWDKQPLLQLLVGAGKLEQSVFEEAMAKKRTLDKEKVSGATYPLIVW
jgi:hypothetical protein